MKSVLGARVRWPCKLYKRALIIARTLPIINGPSAPRSLARVPYRRSFKARRIVESGRLARQIELSSNVCICGRVLHECFCIPWLSCGLALLVVTDFAIILERTEVGEVAKETFGQAITEG